MANEEGQRIHFLTNRHFTKINSISFVFIFFYECAELGSVLVLELIFSHLKPSPSLIFFGEHNKFGSSENAEASLKEREKRVL